MMGSWLHAKEDSLLLALAGGHAALVLAVPSLPVLALGLWWNANTLSHYFIHRPFFVSGRLNVLFSLFLTVLLGIPQSAWRDMHLAHHRGAAWRWSWTRENVAETVAIAALWSIILAAAPGFFWTVYLPAYAIGLVLCGIHGHYEHAAGTTSHYGRLYNRLFFNDGFHVEHHADPGLHWTRLPERKVDGARASRWPAFLRWLERPLLERLESAVFRSRRLQGWILSAHRRALRRLLAPMPRDLRIGIVGGGLFPRTALILRDLAPGASLTIIDASLANLRRAQALLGDTPIAVRHERFDRWRHGGFDVLIFPLSYVGDRGALYNEPPAPVVLVHDWLWRRRGSGAVVSLWLLKRINRMTRSEA